MTKQLESLSLDVHIQGVAPQQEALMRFGDRMQFWPDSLQSPGAGVRRWFIAAIVLLPIAMTVSGLNSYYLTESWVSFKPHAWGEIAEYMVVAQSQYGGQYYRPFAWMMQATELKLFSTNPLVPRAINSISYAMICLLVFLILEALSQNFLIGALGSSIFSVMACHVMPVFWMSQIQGLNSALLTFLSFWLLGPSYRKKPSRTKIALACISYVAGFLFYEYAIFIPLLLLIYELIWRKEQGFRRLIRHLLKINLPMWVLAGALLGLRALILHSNVVTNHFYFHCIRELTLLTVIKRLPIILYTNVLPLEFSPVLCAVAAIMVYVGFRTNWRFTLFLVLWIAVTPVLAFPLPCVAHHRVLLNSLGVAGLMAYLIFLLPETILESRKCPSMSRILDWIIAASLVYWVFELIRVGWIDFFHQGASTINTRYAAAVVAAVGLVARCAFCQRLSPRMSRAPLKFLSIGLILLLAGGYMASFLKLFSMFVEEARESARIPKAIVAAQPQVPDNTLVLIAFSNRSLLDKVGAIWNIRAPIRAEYGCNVDTLPFSEWVNNFQYRSIPEQMSVRVFAYDGDDALELRDISTRVLARQESYLNLNDNVVHARFMASESPSTRARLIPDADLGLIDRLDIVTDRPLENATVRLELVSNDAPTVISFPAGFDATETTLRLEQSKDWLLARNISEVRVEVIDNGLSIPIHEAALVQSAGLISHSTLRLESWEPKLGPALRSDSLLGKVHLNVPNFPAEHPARYFRFP